MSEDERGQNLGALERTLMDHPNPTQVKAMVWTLEDLEAEHNRLLKCILPAFQSQDWIAVQRQAGELATISRRIAILQERVKLTEQLQRIETKEKI